MAVRLHSADDFVTTLVPSLSRSLAERFNIFRVMHHGTHEKQLSNVFAWLLDAEASHDLGNSFQRIFLTRVNAGLPNSQQLPVDGYRVVQEVDTRSTAEIDADGAMDIADIVLSRSDAAVIVENYETSDGHGHDYHRYLAHGTAGDRAAAVVLLCLRHETFRLSGGWERAVLITYADLLRDLQSYVDRTPQWAERHPDQLLFVRQMIEHFVEGPAAVSSDDRIRFITAMCETGESARYGHRPQERAAQEFADLIAEHARRQFEESRATLAATKAGLRVFARDVLTEQLNAALHTGPVEATITRFVGQWEWCVELRRAEQHPAVFLEFGPTAVVENERVPEPITSPDYSRVFVSLQAPGGEGIVRILQTEVGLGDVLDGLPRDDHRLRDAVLEVLTHG